MIGLTVNQVLKMNEQWQTVCEQKSLIADSGICVLFNGEQVAVFYDKDEEKLYAISNYDPIGEANVLSRGIVGSIAGELVVASPLYKQHFSLLSGACLEDDNFSVKTYIARIENGEVQLQEG